MSRFMRKGALGAAGIAVVLLAVGGIASASIPDRDGVIRACYDQRSGQVRIVDPETGSPRGCGANEVAISWNQTGRQGDPGAPGAKGDKGDPGEPGPKGEKGDAGNLGLAGAACPAGQVLTGFDADGGLVCDGASLVISPADHDFGHDSIVHYDPLGNLVFYGGPSTEFTVTNDGVLPSGSLDMSASTTDDAGEFLYDVRGCQGVSLLPGESCTVEITFNPSSSGVKTVTLTASATPGGSASAALTGTGGG